jgi:hypothetical protein
VRGAFFAAALSLALGVPRQALAAEDDKRACVDAYTDAQNAALDGSLKRARAQASRCMAEACPGVVRAECERLAGELDGKLPSIVVRVREGEDDVSSARVSIDGVIVTDRLDGKPIALDPGEHVVRAELADRAPLERRIVAVLGERLRAIEFVTPRPSREPIAVERTVAPDPSPNLVALPAMRERPVPTITVVLGAAALAAATSAVTFAVLGHVEHARLEASCAPACPDASLRELRRDDAIVDVSLAVGLAAAFAGVGTYLARPVVSGSHAAWLRLVRPSASTSRASGVAPMGWALGVDGRF